MSVAPQRFLYVPRDPSLGHASLAPMLPLTLMGNQNLSTTGLLDSGAALNVLPFSVGQQLGLDWSQQKHTVELSGNLAAREARVIVVTARIGSFSPVRLAFAWSQLDSVPIILGQVNFFMEFDVCFFRSRSVFEVRIKA